MSESDTFKEVDASLDVEETEGDYRVFSGDRLCENCQHAPVCTVLAGIRPMMQNWSSGMSGEDGEPTPPPIDLNEMALICSEYLPADD